MDVVQMSPAALVPYENNTKTHPPEQVDRIAESIKRFGWQQPIATKSILTDLLRCCTGGGDDWQERQI